MSQMRLALEYIESLNIPYEIVHHQKAYTMEDMKDFGLCEKGDICKNLFLRDQKGKRHFLVMVCGDKQVDLKAFGELLGTKLSFASEDRLMKYMGLIKGAVTPLGVINDMDCQVEVVFDQEMKGKERLGIHPNDNSATIFLSFDNLKKAVEHHGNAITYLKID